MDYQTLDEAMKALPKGTFIQGRHPYTYAADFIRQATLDPHESVAQPCTLSRAQASAIRKLIADVIGMDDAELAEKLSNEYRRRHLRD